MDFTGSNDSTRKPRYLLTHFDRVQALIIISWLRDKFLRVVHM